MKEKLLLWLLGEQKISFHKKDTTYVMNFLLQNSIEFHGYSEAEERGELSCKKEKRERLDRLSAHGHYTVEPMNGGIISYIKRIRLGVLVGGLLAAAIIFFSGLFVWEVRVETPAGIDDDAVVSAIEQAGLRVGSFIPTANLDHVEQTLLTLSEEIGWIHIYMQGSIATVEIVGKEEPPIGNIDASPANLIADCDAVITEVIVTTGKAVVKRGSVVKRGDLLVSGVLPGVHATEFVKADGAVLGECKKSFLVEIPLTYEKRKRESEKKQKISINFFGYSINIYEDTGNLDATYDTIYRRRDFSFFGLFSLPITWEETVLVSYVTEECRLTPVEAVRAAERSIRAEYVTLLGESELVSRSYHGEFREDSYFLALELVCITDITSSVPIQTDQSQ